MWKIEMDQASAGSVLAALVCAVACLSGGGSDDKDTGYDTGNYRWSDSGWGGEGEGEGEQTGDIYAGYYGLYIEEYCGLVWDMTGYATGDLVWTVSLFLNSISTCEGASDTTGSFELARGNAYFDGSYVGSASYGGGWAVWSTSGYIVGGAGGSYYYSGNINY
jgi:hypothetical protein